MRSLLPTISLAAAVVVAGCHHPVALTPTSQGVKIVSRVGFNQPENIVYDSVADVYLVSNMGPGDPAARDDNGFISRVSSDGRMLNARWISAANLGVTLDAPKGMLIRGDTLVVADVGAVRFFNRKTGMPLESITIPGIVLNDVAYGANGTLWITDTGPDRTKTPVDTTRDLDTVWELGKDRPVVAAARGLSLERPDGIVVDSTSALVSTFGGDNIERVDGVRHSVQIVATLPGGRADGLRRMADGSLLVTSWDAKTVWRLDHSFTPEAILTGITSPAGVAVDTRHHRVAVTSMQGNQLYLVPLP